MFYKHFLTLYKRAQRASKNITKPDPKKGFKIFVEHKNQKYIIYRVFPRKFLFSFQEEYDYS